MRMFARRKMFVCLFVLSPLVLVAPAGLRAQQKASAAVDPLARCSQSLVPYADWPAVKDPSFSLDLPAGSGARLVYMGARHSTDIADPQFDEIERAWNALKPTVAFYEGPNRPVAATREETIKQTGESGFVRFLAARDGVPFVTLEPSPQDEAAFVLKKFPAEQVELFYVLREAARLRDRRKLAGAELDGAVAKLLERAAAMTGAAPFTTIDGLDAAYRRYWTEPAD